jgi:hypothetical protein
MSDGMKIFTDGMKIFTLPRRRSLRRLLLALGVFAVISLILRGRASWVRPHDEVPMSHIDRTSTKSFIVASRKNDDTTWIEENLPDWDLVRYVVDDPEARYTVPKNKGREAMVYLT